MSKGPSRRTSSEFSRGFSSRLSTSSLNSLNKNAIVFLPKLADKRLTVVYSLFSSDVFIKSTNVEVSVIFANPDKSYVPPSRISWVSFIDIVFVARFVSFYRGVCKTLKTSKTTLLIVSCWMKRLSFSLKSKSLLWEKVSSLKSLPETS